MPSTRERIVGYIQAVEHSPTVREIAAHVGCSPANVHNHLDRLERDGLIRRIGEQRRIYPARAEA